MVLTGLGCWRADDARLDMSGLFVLADELAVVVGSWCLECAEDAEDCVEDSWLVVIEDLIV